MTEEEARAIIEATSDADIKAAKKLYKVNPMVQVKSKDKNFAWTEVMSWDQVSPIQQVRYIRYAKKA